MAAAGRLRVLIPEVSRIAERTDKTCSGRYIDQSSSVPELAENRWEFWIG